MQTIKAKLIAKEHDLGGYTAYVFKVLEQNPPFGHNYIMVTRLPNWNHKNVDLEEVGYLTYKEVNAGDLWYCQETGKMVPYNYTNIYFIKFILEKQQDNSKYITI